jgi:hypothetical protein
MNGRFLIFIDQRRPCLSLSLSVRLSVRQSVRPSVRPSVHPSVRPSINQPLCPYVDLSHQLILPISPSVSLFVCLSDRLSVCRQSVCLSVRSTLYLLIHLSVSINPSTHTSVHMSICPSACVSIKPCVHPFVCLLSVSL